MLLGDIIKLQDQIGERGEHIFSARISAFHGERGALFRPHFLGDKWPFADFIVECYDDGPIAPYFFVQVRATRKPFLLGDVLQIGIDEKHMRGLVRYPAPTYIAGIHEPSEEVYILSANGETGSGLSRIPASFPLDPANREQLWLEVKGFWREPGMPKLKSAFSPPL